MSTNNKKRNVLFVILSLEIGGMEQVVSDLILNLDRSRFNPVVVCLDSLGQLACELEKHNIEIIKLKTMLPVVSYLFPLKLMEIIKKYRINVIHTQSGCWHKAAMAGFLCGVKTIIYTDHGRHSPDIKKVIYLDRVYSLITTDVVCVSQELAEYMSKVVGIPRRLISCIINGVDEKKFIASRSSQKDFSGRIGIIARLVPVKDLPTLLLAIKILKDKNIRVTLTIAGDGPERRKLEQLASSLFVEGIVTFLGFRRDISTILSNIDIFVLSSLSEGTSVTLLEAMSAGKPVVVTNVGGNPAIVNNGVNGIVVPPGDPEAMALALCCLLEDREMRERMSIANINSVSQHYSLRNMVESYEKLYGTS